MSGRYSKPDAMPVDSLAYAAAVGEAQGLILAAVREFESKTGRILRHVSLGNRDVTTIDDTERRLEREAYLSWLPTEEEARRWGLA